MKAKVEYITKVVKEIEVPDKWAEWAESDWKDETVYEEIEQFWQDIAKTEDEYYFKPSGSMAVGWLNYEGFWYFFNNTNDTYIGSMLSNIWWNDKGKLYYFDAGGRMVTGWQTIKDEHGIEHQYYFYPHTAGSSQYGFLATSTNINGIAVDASGRRLY